MTTFYDAITVANIPADAIMVAAYIDGKYANLTAMQARFPNATIVKIAVSASTDDGDVLDVETGDATPAQAPQWVALRRLAGHTWPTIYCNDSTLPAVVAAMSAANVPHPNYWIAEWGPASGQGTPHIPWYAVACQYDHDLPPGYDISESVPNWPPVPAPVAFTGASGTYTLGPNGELASLQLNV